MGRVFLRPSTTTRHTTFLMASRKTNPTFDMDVVSTSDARKILKDARARGGRKSKYSPIYDEIEGLDKGKFVVLRSVDKSTKTSLYQGIMRRYDDMKMASGREKSQKGEFWTVVIGRAEDYDTMRETAKNA